MKVYLIRLTILSVVMILAHTTASTQNLATKGENVSHIFLVVDLSLSGKALKKALIIKDNESTSLPIHDGLKNHTTIIDSTGSVFWKSIPKDPVSNESDSVWITKVKKKFWFFGGEKLLEENKIDDSDGPIIGEVKDVYLPDEERYSIYFTVYKSGKTKKYKVDPKLKMKPPRFTFKP